MRSGFYVCIDFTIAVNLVILCILENNVTLATLRMHEL